MKVSAPTAEVMNVLETQGVICVRRLRVALDNGFSHSEGGYGYPANALPVPRTGKLDRENLGTG